jgi:hypothetical protein
MNNDMFDGVLMNIVQKAEGIEGFYDAIFSFMRRKTDFFTSPEKAREMVLNTFSKNEMLFREEKHRMELIKKKQEELKKKQEEEAKVKEEEKTQEPESKVEEITDEEAEKLMKEQEKEKAGEALMTEMEKKEGEGDSDDDKTPPLIGNGLRTSKYFFTQTLQDITINVFIPSHIKAKDLNVEYGQKKLKVQIKGEDPIIDGELPEKILAEETLWTCDTIEGERVVSITLDK